MNFAYFPEGGRTTPGVEEVGRTASSGASNHEEWKSRRAASLMVVSMLLGMNMFARAQTFSNQVVVFSMFAAVEMRFRELMREGTRRATSWAIIPPIETPDMLREREEVQPRWSRSSTRSSAIWEVE